MVTEGGKRTGAERESVSQTERSMPDCSTKSKEKIKCFSLLLGSSRCAGLVTLVTGNGAEHLIGVCACERVSHAEEDVQIEKSIHSLLADAHLEKHYLQNKSCFVLL